MKIEAVTVVRVYLTESSGLLKKVTHYLAQDAKIRGMSVFRAISGFGQTGIHSAALLDLSLDLPIVIEFFDQTGKIEIALEYLSTFIKPDHMIWWEATANLI